MARLFRILAIIAALQLLGGHWAILQTAAWVQMTVSFSRADSIPAALAKTFSGEHPCKLCVAVKKGRSEEQRQHAFKITFKTEAILQEALVTRCPSWTPQEFVPFIPHYATRSIPPPTPPPLA